MLVMAAVLASAILHATWNALAHRVPEPMAAMALIGLGLLALSLPLLLIVPAPSVAARPWLALSLGLHVGYVALLARSYRLGDFGQVYPIARGTAPLVVTFAAALLLDERLSGPALLGVLVVCGGLVLLAVGRSGSRDAVVAALLTGLAISAYTVVDGAGVRADGGRLGYSVWLLAGVGLGMFSCSALVFRRRLADVLSGRWWLVPVGGLLGWLSYALVLWAQARGALGAVAALRETGVIVAAVIGTVVFGERFGRRRVAATVLVVTGIVLINLPN
jgi:drug/metabolite transporter (DMT)-like permease